MNEQQLAERMAISDVLHRYATAIDTRDWALLDSVFDDEISTDFTSFGGKAFKGPRADWIAAIRETVGGLTATQHLTANHVHSIDGERARLIAYLQAVHLLEGGRGDGEYTVGGRYEIDLARTPAGWRIRHYTLILAWQRGNRDVMRQARRRAA